MKLYQRAPITEAIIDLRIKPQTDLELEPLQDLWSGEQGNYPKVERTYEAMGRMAIQAGVSPSASAQQRQTGFKLTNIEGPYVWQSRVNGFTFSRLAPYQSWELFRSEAQRLWALYRQRVNPNVSRLAVRYINRIDISATNVDLKQYFRTSPEVSPDLPQALTDFFMQLRILEDDLNSEVLINQAVIPSTRQGVVSVVLDVDLFRDKDVPGTDKEIWQFFEKLRIRKNEIFEACITDATRELFK